RRRQRRKQRVRECRFALVEARGMKRFLEREELVVEVMAYLVGQRAHEASEGNDLALARRTHPHGDARRGPPVDRLVEAVQLAVVTGRTLRENAHPDRRHVIAGDERIDDRLAMSLDV